MQKKLYVCICWIKLYDPKNKLFDRQDLQLGLVSKAHWDTMERGKYLLPEGRIKSQWKIGNRKQKMTHRMAK